MPATSPKVCLVNDDATQLMFQKRLLGSLGADVTSFASAVEALAHVRKGESPNLLITDLHMPDVMGYELARVWCDTHSEARVLILTASLITPSEASWIEALPIDKVKVLASYRLAEFQDLASSWLLKVDSKPILSIGTGLAENRINEHALRQLTLLGGTSFAKQTLDRFLKTYPKRVQGILSAYERDDHHAMSRLAHALKGSCGLIGASLLQEAADALELAGEGTTPSELQANILRFQTEAKETLAALQAIKL